MKERNIRLLYWHEAFFSFSDTMLVIVLPLFLLKIFGSLTMVFLWFAVLNLIYGLLFLSVFNRSLKSGRPKYFMAIGMIFYVVSQLFFGLAEKNEYFIVPATLIFALYITFYWPTRHWFFASNADFQKIGKQVSNITIIRIAITVLAPISAGLISFFASFNAAFLLGAGAGLVAVIPILRFHAPSLTGDFQPTNMIKKISEPSLKAIRPAYFWEGFSSTFINLCWILAFAVFIGSIKDLGFLIGISALIAGILTHLTGHRFDQKKRVQLLNQTTRLKVLGGLLYSSVFFYPQLTYIYLTNTLNQLIETAHQTTVYSYLYAYGTKIHPVYFNLNREIFLTLGRFLSSASLAAVFYFLPDQFLWLAIAIGAFMALGWMHLKKSDHLLR